MQRSTPLSHLLESAYQESWSLWKGSNHKDINLNCGDLNIAQGSLISKEISCVSINWKGIPRLGSPLSTLSCLLVELVCPASWHKQIFSHFCRRLLVWKGPFPMMDLTPSAPPNKFFLAAACAAMARYYNARFCLARSGENRRIKSRRALTVP